MMVALSASENGLPELREKTKPRASAPATTRTGFLAMSRAVFFFAPSRPARARVNAIGARDYCRGSATAIAVERLDTIAERFT